MAVVINEFEVVPGDSTPVQESGPTAAGEAEPSAPPSAREQERLAEQKRRREERVWAH